MTMRTVTSTIDRFATAGVFAIAGHRMTEADVVTVTIEQDGHVGRGEGCGIFFQDETPDSIAREVAAASGLVENGCSRDELSSAMPIGGARNAVDCALWDLEAKLTGVTVAERLNTAMMPRRVNFTIGIDSVAAMAARAASAPSYPVLKVKLDGTDDIARIAAIRQARPDATILVDANASWGPEVDLGRHIAELARHGVVLIEQPVPIGQDHRLDRFESAIPLCADESILDRSTLDIASGRYQLINIKLDKTGGLTEALALKAEAKARGFATMIGCMLSSSLGIAPAWYLAEGCEYLDLDSPLLLAEDRPVPVRYEDGHLLPPDPALWG